MDVKIVGKFSSNLIQKNNMIIMLVTQKNMLVCSKYEYHIDKANQQESNTRPYRKEEFRIIPGGTKARYARHSVSWSSCVPLDAMQESCSANQLNDLHRHQEEEDDASSHAASDTPQKHDRHPSLVQMNSKTADIPEAYSSRTCARK